MLFFSLSFLLGNITMQSCSVLPYLLLLAMLAILAMLILIKNRRHFLCLSAAGFLLGYAWAGWYANLSMRTVLSRELEGKPLIMRGIIQSLPVIDTFGQHFIFELANHAKIKLSWARTEILRVGDEYEFNLRLKRVHGLQNPGGFDYEAWLFQHDIHATGSVIKNKPYRLIRHHIFYAPINQIRQLLQQRIRDYLPDSKTSPWLFALMIGERDAAPAEHWQILRATGTNHLMAIAGLHIGLISGMVYWLMQVVWRRNRYLISIYPVQLAAACASLITAWVYSLLAGFSIPTQRACIMVSFYLFALLSRRQLPAWHAFFATLMVVMLINPLVVLSESYWLSFGTLALIAYGMSGRLHPGGWWWKWGRVQWVIGFGLIPLSLLFFQQTSIISLVANSLAIPFLGFLILPFCLLSSIFLFLIPPLGGAFLWIADNNLALLWKILEWFAHLDFAVLTLPIISPIIFMTTLCACLLILLPAGLPGRWLGVIWMLPLVLIHPAKPPENDFWVSVLDVGQGLSVVIQTRQHALLYDAGPKFGHQFDMGESVVLPFLRSAGIQKLDAMIISHGDNDHIGGADAILNAMPVRTILTSAVDKMATHQALLCLAGQHWQWDGVEFTMLYPFRESLTLGNDSSCVLRISNHRHSVLLTGDIEKFAEKQLLTQSVEKLKSDILTAPHHGSKTSSQHEFIAAVMPQYVIYATGYRNRYHFPHQPVVNAYTQAGVLQLNTTASGAIQFQMGEGEAIVKPVQYRLSHQRYWQD